MRPSPLQLESYYVTELHFAEQGHGASEEESALTPADLQVEVGSATHEENSLKRIYQLTIELTDEAQKRLPYTFRVVLVGFFEISKHYPSEHAEVMVNANAPALLYSAARELLTLISGRSFSAPVLLPSVTFIQPVEQAEATTGKASKSAKPASKKASAKGGAKTARKK
jgi:preprotein translocase subunit SecB